jgi:hypothetical protein
MTKIQSLGGMKEYGWKNWERRRKARSSPRLALVLWFRSKVFPKIHVLKGWCPVGSDIER